VETYILFAPVELFSLGAPLSGHRQGQAPP
jgi:hypothetical protein